MAKWQPVKMFKCPACFEVFSVQHSNCPACHLSLKRSEVKFIESKQCSQCGKPVGDF